MTNKKKSDVEVLDREVPQDKWAAKPLSLAGTARLIEFVGTTLDDAVERSMLENTLREEEGRDLMVNPILMLFRIFDEDRLANLLSIVTGQSKTWIKKNWAFAQAAKSLRDFIEKEDLGEILGNLVESRDLLSGVLAGMDTGSPESLINSSASTEEPQTTG